MPGTTYTRTGPENDAFGRLADFARFAVAELDEMLDKMGDGPDPLGAKMAAASLCDHSQALADLLRGFTTAND